MTSISTHNPVRTDVDTPFPAAAVPGTQAPSRLWTVAGLVGAVASGAGMAAGGMVHAVYDPQIAGNAPAILDAVAEKVPALVALHVTGAVAMLVLPVFGLGLYRRLRSRLEGDTLLPALAAFGVLATAIVLLMGGALNTEFIFAVGAKESVLPESVALYDHWINTVPGCWALTGLSGVAVFLASRKGAAPRWLGIAGLVLGGLSIVTAIAPLQYMAGATGTLWLFLTALGFAAGDRAHRSTDHAAR